MLIVGRAVAGMGAAGLFSGALVIIAHSIAPRQRPSVYSPAHRYNSRFPLTLSFSLYLNCDRYVWYF